MSCPCMWPMAHRNKQHDTGRICGCACWLPKGHDGPHRCDQEVPEDIADAWREARASHMTESSNRQEQHAATNE